MSKIYVPSKLERKDDFINWFEKFNQMVDSLDEVSNTYGDIDDFGGKSLSEYLDERNKEMFQNLLGILIAMS